MKSNQDKTRERNSSSGCRKENEIADGFLYSYKHERAYTFTFLTLIPNPQGSGLVSSQKGTVSVGGWVGKGVEPQEQEESKSTPPSKHLFLSQSKGKLCTPKYLPPSRRHRDSADVLLSTTKLNAILPNLPYKFKAILIKASTGFFKKYMISKVQNLYRRAKGQKILKNHMVPDLLYQY